MLLNPVGQAAVCKGKDRSTVRTLSFGPGDSFAGSGNVSGVLSYGVGIASTCLGRTVCQGRPHGSLLRVSESEVLSPIGSLSREPGLFVSNGLGRFGGSRLSRGGGMGYVGGRLCCCNLTGYDGRGNDWRQSKMPRPVWKADPGPSANRVVPFYADGGIKPAASI